MVKRTHDFMGTKRACQSCLMTTQVIISASMNFYLVGLWDGAIENLQDYITFPPHAKALVKSPSGHE